MNIRIAKLIAPIISSRDVIDILRNAITSKKEDVYILDFSSVEFISRSAAHELIEFMETTDKDIRLAHVRSNVKRMLNVIEKTKNIQTKPVLSTKRVSLKAFA